MKLILTILILLSAYINSCAQNKVITKATIIRSGIFVTVNSDPKELENLVNKALSKRGYQILKNLEPDTAIFFVDLFVFQSPGDFPSITLTIRTINGVYYIDKEHIKLYTDRKLANKTIVSILSERLPKTINTNLCYKLTFKDIFTSNIKNPEALNTHCLPNETKTTYSTVINWNDNDKPDFLFKNEFETYFATVFDFRVIKKQLKGKVVRIKLKINEFAEFEVAEILSPESLSIELKSKILEAVDSFPLWVVNEQMENIELKFNAL